MTKTISLCGSLLALFALFVSSLTACGSNTGRTEQPKEFKSETGGFSITTPFPLKEITQSIDTEAGKMVMHTFRADQGRESWVVAYSDLPVEIVRASDSEGMLNASRDGAVSNVNGELVSDGQISLNEYPGREFVVSGQRQGEQDLSLRARIFLVENRLYQVMAVVPKGQENSKEVDDFLQSFQLIGK